MTLCRPHLRLAFAILAALCASVPTANAQGAEPTLQARIDPPVADEMQTVRLTLRVEGSNRTENLDLAGLEDDFEVLATNTSSQFQSINGRVQSWVEYQVNLRPKRTGRLEIPAISIGDRQSAPLHVTVRPLAPEIRQAIDRMVFFEVDVTPNPVYVQAQAIMSRRLYYSSGVQIYSDLPGVPDIPNAVVIPLGEARSTTEARPEGRYGVLEQRYAIFPEESGSLVIPEISVTSSVRLESGGRARRSGIRVSTPEIRLDVLPVPAAYPPDRPWLPARQVTIGDAWEPDNLAFELGEPVQRTLTVNVAGNTGSAIPPILPGLPEAAFKQYPEPVEISEDTVAADIVGTRKQAYSVVPVASGTVQLPELRLTWWDTVNERVREATSASVQVRVAGEPVAALEFASPDSAGAATEAAALEPPPEAAPPPSVVTRPYPEWLVGLTVFAFCGWAATWLVMRRGRAKSDPRPPNPQQEASLKELRAACRQGDAKLMRDAWIRHFQIRWKVAPDRAAAMIRQNPEGRRLLDALNRALYSASPAETPDGQAIWEAARSMPPPGRRMPEEALPELYVH